MTEHDRNRIEELAAEFAAGFLDRLDKRLAADGATAPALWIGLAK